MLSHIFIKRFRSCVDLSIEFGPGVTPLVGRNGVGKTNILHAIQYLGAIGTQITHLPNRMLVGPPRHRGVDISAEFRLGGMKFNFAHGQAMAEDDVVINEKLLVDDNTVFSRTGAKVSLADGQEQLSISKKANTLPSLVQLLADDHPIAPIINILSEYLGKLLYYPVSGHRSEHSDKTRPFILKSEFKDWRPSDTGKERDFPILCRLVDLHLRNQERFKELQSLIGPDGLDLIDEIRVEDIDIPFSEPADPDDGGEQGFFIILFRPSSQMAGSGGVFPYTGLSSGTWRVIQMLTMLLYEQSPCVLLEQPEDYIHPALLVKLVSLLETYTSSSQAIVTTHSEHLMNCLPPGMVRLVWAEEGATKARPLNPSEIDSANRFLQEEGTLAEFLNMVECQ